MKNHLIVAKENGLEKYLFLSDRRAGVAKGPRERFVLGHLVDQSGWKNSKSLEGAHSSVNVNVVIVWPYVSNRRPLLVFVWTFCLLTWGGT
jgi:hypothetical protein